MVWNSLSSPLNKDSVYCVFYVILLCPGINLPGLARQPLNALTHMPLSSTVLPPVFHAYSCLFCGQADSGGGTAIEGGNSVKSVILKNPSDSA